MSAESRRREKRKLVSFTDDEWQQIEGRMEMSGARSFDAWARETLLGAPIKVVTMPFDPQRVRTELSRLGNNVNQIARQVNADDGAAIGEVQRVRQIMEKVQKTIDDAVREGRRGR